MEYDNPRKVLNLPNFSYGVDGSPRLGRFLLASHFIYCSCIMGIGLLVMGSILTALFQSNLRIDDPFVKNMETTGIVFLVVGCLLTLSGGGLCFLTCVSCQKIPKTSSAAKANVSSMRDDPLSLAPSYPPVVLPPANPYMTPGFLSALGQDDQTVLPGFVMGESENSLSDSQRSTPEPQARDFRFEHGIP